MKSAGKTVNGTIMAQFDDEYVVLLEQSIASNKHVVEENRRLRDELKTKEEQNSKVLSEVLKELQQLKEKHWWKGKRSSERQEVNSYQGSIFLSSKFIKWKHFSTFISSPRSCLPFQLLCECDLR